MHPFTGRPGLTCPVPTTPLGFLQLFFSLELLQYLTEETNQYADYVRNELLLTRSYSWTPLTVAEMATYMGMIILMGIGHLPNLRLYWKPNFPLYAPAFAQAMSCSRFLAITRYFHSYNRKAIPKTNKNKLIIVTPIMEYLQRKCRTILIPDRELSLDEGTLPFKGRLSIKVYNPQKPHKYGLKFFFVCEAATGYVVDFLMYGGVYRSLRHTVYKLLERFIGQGYHVFMDNYYNSVKLARRMHGDGIHVSGTLRMNRGAPKIIKDLKRRTNLKVGDTFFRRKGDVFVISWFSNRLVTMITTADCCTMEPHLHRTKKKGVYKEVQTQRPRCIRQYTAHMGGVDLFDQMVNYYSFARRTQRWTKKVIMYLLQLAIQNSYSVYRKYTTDEKKMTLLQYMTMTATSLLNFDEGMWQATGPPLEHAPSLPIEERLDRLPPTPRGLGRTPQSAPRRHGSESEDDPDEPAALPSVSQPHSPPPPPPPSVVAPTPPAAPAPAPEPAADDPPPGPRRPRIYDPPSRLQPGNHKLVLLEGKAKQKRCRVCYMSGRRKDSRYMCCVCQTPLCNNVECFLAYHSRETYWSAPPRGTVEGQRSRRLARQ